MATPKPSTVAPTHNKTFLDRSAAVTKKALIRDHSEHSLFGGMKHPHWHGNLHNAALAESAAQIEYRPNIHELIRKLADNVIYGILLDQLERDLLAAPAEEVDRTLCYFSARVFYAGTHFGRRLLCEAQKQEREVNWYDHAFVQVAVVETNTFDILIKHVAELVDAIMFQSLLKQYKEDLAKQHEPEFRAITTAFSARLFYAGICAAHQERGNRNQHGLLLLDSAWPEDFPPHESVVL